MANIHDDFGKWVDQWEAAQKNGIIVPPKRTEEENLPAFDDAQTQYWRDLADPNILNENAPVDDTFKAVKVTKPDGKTPAEITDELGGLPNPSNWTNRGKDAKNTVTPNFAGGDEIIELHKMKEQLQKLEDKMAADPMVENEETKKVLAQIDDLWKKLDDLSNTITPDFVKDYLS